MPGTDHRGVAQPFVDAGFDRLALLNAGPDPDGFIDFYQRELAGPIRQLTPSTPTSLPRLPSHPLALLSSI